jgi:hypothetical protein
MVQKLGQSRPSKLEICKDHDHRTPTARRAARATYQVHLRRAIERHFPDFTLTKLSNTMDLERSFGPIYARGDGEFPQFGYFPGRELSPENPLLLLVAPTLHIHPATDTILHYVDTGIDWTLVGIDERWRDRVRVIFRKRPMKDVRSVAPAVGVA